MKSKPNPFLRHLLSAATLGLASPVFALDGTWSADTSPLTWATSGNWASGTVADGSGSTAYFTNNITGDRVVNINADKTITNIVFGDSDTSTAGSWTIANNGTSTNNLILAGTTPTITVNALGTAKTATISAIIEGNAGLTKAGVGTLVLSGTNTYTGETNISEGKLQVASNVIANSSTIKIGAGATLESTGGFTLASGQSMTGTGTTGFVNTTASTGLGMVGNNTLSTSGTLTLTRLAVLGSGNQISAGNIQSGSTSARGLVVGSGGAGTLTIAGGSLTTNGITTGSFFDILGNGAGNSGTLIINSGGSYANNAAGKLSLGNTNASGTLTINNGGSATISEIEFNAGTTGTATSGIVNLNNGGTLTVSKITVTAGTTKQFNFDGGQFIAGSGFTTGSGLTLNVKDGGAKINTNGNSYAITDALLRFSGATTDSLTKSGGGTLTLSSASSTYGGGTIITGGAIRATTSANALGAGTLSLQGGNLELADNTGINFGRNTTVANTTTITSDRTSGGGSVTQTLGTLNIGAQTLNVAKGSFVTSGTAGLTFGATTLTGAAIFDTAASTNLTLGALAGNHNFTKQGSGTMTLTASSTRSSGVTTLSAGTLSLAGGSGTAQSALGTTATTLQLNGGTLDLSLNAASVSAYNTTVGGNAAINLNKFTFSTAIVNTLGTLSMGAYTLSITKGSNTTSNPSLAFGTTTLTAGPAVFDVATNTSLTLGSVSGTGFGLTKQSSGSMTVGNYTAGTVTVNGGTFSSTAGSDNFSPSTKSIVINNGGKFNGLSNGIQNAVIATINNGGTFDLVNNSDAIGGITGAGTLTNSGGTITTLTLDMPGSHTFDGNITGNINLSLRGNETTAGTAQSLTLTHTGNSFSGNVAIGGGTLGKGDMSLALGNSGVITDTAVVTVNGSATASGTGSYIGILDMNGKNEAIAGLAGGAPTGTGTRSGRVTNKGAVDSVLTLNGTGNQSFGGVISDGTTNKLSLTKSGAGTQALTGSNSYTGTTTITDGTLIVDGNISTSSLTTVQTGATLSGSGSVGDLTIDAGGSHNPGNSPGIMNVGDYTMAGTLNIEITGNTPGLGGYDQVNAVGSVNLSGTLATAFSGGTYANGNLLFILLNDGADTISGTFSGLAQNAFVINYGGYNWNISYTADSVGNTFTGGNDIALMAVPEPRASLLGGLGILMLLRRRKR